MTAVGGFRINTPSVTHQTMDGEVVIINLDTGCYYSLQKTGAEIWGLLETGASPDEIVSRLSQRYRADRTLVSEATLRLIGELQQETLISPDAAPGKVSEAPFPSTADVPSSSVFDPPVLQKFTEMQDLLLLDPIHEVDGLGWPNPINPPT